MKGVSQVLEVVITNFTSPLLLDLIFMCRLEDVVSLVVFLAYLIVFSLFNIVLFYH